MKKNAIIFGGSGDLGSEIIQDFLKKGYELVVTYKDKKLNNLKNKFKKYKKSKIFFVNCDLKDEKSIRKLVRFSLKKIGEPKIIINTVGVFYYEKLKNFSYKNIIETFKTNTFPVLAINKEILSIKKNKEYTKIITFGSSSALDGFEDTYSYCGSKHALLSIIKSLNKTIGNKKILNYCLNVGSIKNRMGKKVRSKNYKNFINQKSIVETINFICSTELPAFPEEIFLKRFQS